MNKNSGYRATRPTPTDEAAEKAWEKVMEIAEANGLIVQAYGGVATLAVPEEQRKAGIRERVLRAGLFELEEMKS